MLGSIPTKIQTVAPELIADNSLDQDKDTNLLLNVLDMMENYKVKESDELDELKISTDAVIYKYTTDDDCCFAADKPVALQRLVINAFFRRLIALLPSSITKTAYQVLKEHHTTTTSQWLADVKKHVMPVLIHIK